MWWRGGRRCSLERTFRPIADAAQLIAKCEDLCKTLVEQMEEEDLRAKVFTLKLKCVAVVLLLLSSSLVVVVLLLLPLVLLFVIVANYIATHCGAVQNDQVRASDAVGDAAHVLTRRGCHHPRRRRSAREGAAAVAATDGRARQLLRGDDDGALVACRPRSFLPSFVQS